MACTIISTVPSKFRSNLFHVQSIERFGNLKGTTVEISILLFRYCSIAFGMHSPSKTEREGARARLRSLPPAPREFMNCFCYHLFSGRAARMTVTLPRYIFNRYNAIYNRAHPSISSSRPR